jgi:transcriptional regulator of arginine metabolism
MKEYDNLAAALRDLLMQGTVNTQEELCQALEQQGYAVNQSKISRLLHKIGAVKTKNERGQITYRLPREPAPPQTSSDLSNLVINVTANENLIMVHTSPGAAALIARMLDYHQNDMNILGTIAGDDTILVVPISIRKINEVKKNITDLIFKISK